MVTGCERFLAPAVLRPLAKLGGGGKEDDRYCSYKNTVDYNSFCSVQHQTTYEKKLGTAKSNTPARAAIKPASAAIEAKTRHGERMR
jgi:hypothetical protein